MTFTEIDDSIFADEVCDVAMLFDRTAPRLRSEVRAMIIEKLEALRREARKEGEQVSGYGGVG